MKAVWLERHGGPEVLQVVDRPQPVPGPGEAMVAVKACGINHLDIWVRLGGPRGFPLPLILGSDAAGVVERAPAESGLKAGDEVVIYPANGCGRCPACERGDDNLCVEYKIFGAWRDGGLAEKTCVPARNCLPKPKNLSWEEAAAVAINWITAWHMLDARAQLRPGETILIQAAGSGVSTAAIQLARHLGARVLATSSTPEKLAHARRCGAHEVIDYKKENVLERVRALSGGRGVEVVLDHVGAANWALDLQALAKGGRLVFCGTTSGAEATTSLAAVYFKSQSILGSTMGTRADLRTVLGLMEQGIGKPVVERVYPLEAIQDCHRHLESGRQIGKLVVRVAP